MRFAVDEESRREVAAALDVEDIGFPFRRFGLARMTERERVRAEGCREHAQRQPGEILFDGDGRTRRRSSGSASGATSSLTAGRTRFTSRLVHRSGPSGGGSTGRRGRRGGGTSPARAGTRSVAQLNQPITVEAAAVRTAFPRGDFVGSNVLVRELD